MKLSILLRKRASEGRGMLLSLVYAVILSVVFSITRSDVSSLKVFSYLLSAWAIVFLCHMVLRVLAEEQNQNILPLVSVLILTGTVTILNVAPDHVLRHLISIGVGFLAFTLVLLMSKAIDIEKRVNFFVVAIFVLLLATLILGSKRGGARSWIMFGSFGFQPSEIVKVILILVNAILIVRMNKTFDRPDSVIHSAELKKSKDAWLISSLWAATMSLLVFQNDFGMTLVFYLACLMMAYVATGNKKVVAFGVGFGCAAGVLAATKVTHIIARFSAWLYPWNSPTGSGYQILQSLFTTASGGLFGQGFTGINSRYLPASFTDMNFAVIGEQFGFFGLCALIAVIYLIVSLGLKSASKKDENMVTSLIKVGVSAFLGVQSFIIIAGNLRLVPLTGITIPFISFGGTSMVVSMAMLGMLFLTPKKSTKSALKRTEHMRKSIKLLDKVWTAACILLVLGCAYVQIYSYDKLMYDKYNPVNIRSYQEASK